MGKHLANSEAILQKLRVDRSAPRLLSTLTAKLSTVATNDHDVTPVVAGGAHWREPSARPRLGTDDVHVWRVHILSVFPLPALLDDVLCAEERKRARAIRYERDRRQFVVAHVALRCILSRYLDINAKNIVFEQEPNGKPRLAAACNAPDIHFNISHSADWVLCAVTRGRPVGVDIEYQRANINHAQIAERIFSSAEQRTFERVPERFKSEVLFGAWACKEAYVKAIGQGMFFPFSKVELSLMVDTPPCLVCVSAEARPGHWSLRELYVADQYAGALAVPGPVRTLALWEWSDDALPTHEYVT
jgi:4'-phosphopantetheinyl transferase